MTIVSTIGGIDISNLQVNELKEQPEQEITCPTPPIECPICGAILSDISELYMEEEECVGCYECSCICDRCGHAVSTDTVFDVDGEVWCTYCKDNAAFLCDECRDYMPCNTLNTVGNDEICNSCYNEYYLECDNCGEIIHRNDVYTSNYHDGCLCECCYNDIEDNRIHSYSYRPSSIFHKMPEEIELKDEGFGWELETDSGNRCVDMDGYIDALKRIGDNEKYIYLKEDGSLSDEGVEVVSHVGTLNFWLKSPIIKSVCDAARNAYYHSQNTGSVSCGLHIHASRTLFGETKEQQELAITRMVIVFDRFWSQIIKLSRRTGTQMSDWCRRYDMETQEFDEVRDKNHHYRIISLTTRTIELRMFRGTTHQPSIYAAIEFYDSLIKFCKTADLDTILYCSFDAIREHLEKDTKYLPVYLSQRLDN